MTIHPPEISLADGWVTVSARIEFDTPGFGLPETMWFRFPEKYSHFVTDRADGFVSLLVSLAMRIGEPIVARGRLSPRLLYGLREYQSAVLRWRPPNYRRVDIRCDQLEPPSASEVQENVVTPFSGGVDSSYTLWAHLPRNQPLVDFQVTHALYIQGVDVSLDDEKTMREIVERHSALLERLNIEFIPAASNHYTFSTFRDWKTFRSGLYTAALAQALGRGFRRLISTGNLCYDDVAGRSRSPATDYLFSTETLDVLHHGSGARRYEKLAALAEWEETYTSLRICRGGFHDGFDNCCRCRKCVATMVRMEALGILHKYKTFPRPLRRSLIWRLPLLEAGGLRADRAAIFRDCARSGRHDLIFDLRIAYFLNSPFFWMLRRRYRSLRSTISRRGKSQGQRRPAPEDFS